MGNPATVTRKKTEKRRKKYEQRLGPGVYLPKEQRLVVNEAVKKHDAEAKVKSEKAKQERAAKKKAKPAKPAAKDAKPAPAAKDDKKEETK